MDFKTYLWFMMKIMTVQFIQYNSFLKFLWLQSGVDQPVEPTRILYMCSHVVAALLRHEKSQLEITVFKKLDNVSQIFTSRFLKALEMMLTLMVEYHRTNIQAHLFVRSIEHLHMHIFLIHNHFCMHSQMPVLGLVALYNFDSQEQI